MEKVNDDSKQISDNIYDDEEDNIYDEVDVTENEIKIADDSIKNSIEKYNNEDNSHDENEEEEDDEVIINLTQNEPFSPEQEKEVLKICPNVCELVGPKIAHLLIKKVGNLEELAKTTADVVMMLGKEVKKEKSTSNEFKLTKGIGFNTNQVGFIGDCDLIHKETPKIPKLRKKVANTIANKLVLCARIDLASSSSNKSDVQQGMNFKEEVRKKIAKLCEPPPAKQIKPIPVPDEFNKKNRKRRGGKRVRKWKKLLRPSKLKEDMSKVHFLGDEADDDQNLEMFEHFAQTTGIKVSNKVNLAEMKNQEQTILREVEKKKKRKRLNSVYGKNASQNPNNNPNNTASFTQIAQNTFLQNTNNNASGTSSILSKASASTTGGMSMLAPSAKLAAGTSTLSSGNSSFLVASSGSVLSTSSGRKTPFYGNTSKMASGLASSLIFTPIQGIELENPTVAKKRLAEFQKLQQQPANDVSSLLEPPKKKAKKESYFESLSFRNVDIDSDDVFKAPKPK